MKCVVCVFCSGLICSSGLVAHNNIQVALSGDTVHLHYQVAETVNISQAYLGCYSPNNSIILTPKLSKIGNSSITLTHVKSSDSGSYRCELTGVVNEKAYWFLHVRGEL